MRTLPQSASEVVAYAKTVGKQCSSLQHEQLRSLVRVFDQLPSIKDPDERLARLKFDLAMKLSDHSNLKDEAYIHFKNLVEILRDFLKSLGTDERYFQQESYYQEFVRSVITYAKS